MEILTALAIAPFLAALVLGAREAELDEQNSRQDIWQPCLQHISVTAA